jgi:hypothetical protein
MIQVPGYLRATSNREPVSGERETWFFQGREVAGDGGSFDLFFNTVLRR